MMNAPTTPGLQPSDYADPTKPVADFVAMAANRLAAEGIDSDRALKIASVIVTGAHQAGLAARLPRGQAYPDILARLYGERAMSGVQHPRAPMLEKVAILLAEMSGLAVFGVQVAQLIVAEGRDNGIAGEMLRTAKALGIDAPSSPPSLQPPAALPEPAKDEVDPW